MNLPFLHSKDPPLHLNLAAKVFSVEFKVAWFVDQITSVIQLIFQIFSKLGKTLNKAASRKDLMNLALCFFTTSTPRMNFMHPPRQKKFHDIDIVFKEICYSLLLDKCTAPC